MVLADFEMNGTWRTDDEYKSLDFRMIPCASQYTAFDGTIHGGDESCVWDKEEVVEWLGPAMDVMALHNQPIFKQDKYYKDRIQKTSKIQQQLTATNQASWTDTNLLEYELIDETSLVQIGQTDEQTFQKISFDSSTRSTWDKWPTKEKPGFYKIQSFWMNISHSLTSIERQTYSTLELFGDVGGLFECLKLIAALFVTPVATFALKAELLAHSFRKYVTGHEKGVSPVEANLNRTQVAGTTTWLDALKCCCMAKGKRKMRLLDRANTSVTNQLDLFNFIKWQRMTQLTSLVLLNSK